MKNSREIIVVAPTVEMGRMVAKDFGVSREKVYTRAQSLYGLSDCVILLYEPMMFSYDHWQQIHDALQPGKHTVINVPEYKRINRQVREW